MSHVDDLWEPNDREPTEPDEELDDLDGDEDLDDGDYYDPHAS